MTDGLLIEDPREPVDLRRFSHEAMATVFEIVAVHPDERYAAQAAQAAFALLDRLEQDLSRFLPNSDISRVNLLRAGERVRVSASTLECLVIARHMYELTGGAFDVSIGTGLASLGLEAAGSLVSAAVSGVRLDLGGIGKGYAVDLMAETLEEWGLERALIHGGFSSVLALDGPPGSSGWPVTLSDPQSSSRVLIRRSIRQTALGASGLRKGEHIVDPRTGGPVSGRRASWVSIPRPARESDRRGGPRMAAAAVADALATAFMSASEDAIAELCQRTAGLEGWIVPDGEDGPRARPLLHFGAA